MSEEQFYDVVDSEGAVVETAEAQQAEAAPVEPPKPLTRRQIGAIRKQYVTIQHPRVRTCNHRLDLNAQPRHRNCQYCWFAWFNGHGEVVQQLDEMHTSGTDALIISLQGVKFLHRWLQFMATVARFKAEQQEYNDTNQETDGQGTS
jgi:hypothetical protein